jgi:hypothetical protein
MMSALDSSLASLDRQRLSTHAVNLAESILAEIQLGIRPLSTDSAKPLSAPFQDWTAEVSVTPVNGPVDGSTRLQRVEVVVRHLQPAWVQRLCQVLRPAAGTPSPVTGTEAAGGGIAP